MRPGTAIRVTDEVETLELLPDKLKSFNKALLKKATSIFTLLHRIFAIIHDLSVGELPESPTAANIVSKLNEDDEVDVPLELFAEADVLIPPVLAGTGCVKGALRFWATKVSAILKL